MRRPLFSTIPAPLPIGLCERPAAQWRATIRVQSGRSRYASRALALASLHFFCSIRANASRASAARLPAFDCSADRPCSEIDCRRRAQHAIIAPRKTNRRIRRARISSGGVRSRSSFFATGRDGCFGTRDVYYGATADATRTAFTVEAAVSAAVIWSCTAQATTPAATERAAPALRFPEAHGANQSPPLKPAQAQEHRASHPRLSRAQERSCHLSGCYRVGSGDRRHWTVHR